MGCPTNIFILQSFHWGFLNLITSGGNRSFAPAPTVSYPTAVHGPALIYPKNTCVTTLVPRSRVQYSGNHFAAFWEILFSKNWGTTFHDGFPKPSIWPEGLSFRRLTRPPWPSNFCLLSRFFSLLQLQSMAEVTMKFLGPSLVLTNSMFPEDRLSEVMVLQQHCGGSTLCVFRELLPPNSKLILRETVV